MERQTITSRQNPLVKFVCGLVDKKKRTKEGLFRFDGVKLFDEAARSGLEFKHIICREPLNSYVQGLIASALENGYISDDSIIYVSDSVFEKLSEEHSPEGIICVAYQPKTLHADCCTELPAKNEKIIIFESMRDPGNLGTVIRSAYALGIDRIILTDDCADIYNSKAVRAAMGAIFRMPTLTVKVNELPQYIEALKGSGRRVFATALAESSVSIAELELVSGDCFVIGNEGHGLTRECIDACDASVIIPMRENAESLNAASAASICIWETVKA